MSLPKFYLASQSPRRGELLQQIGVKFERLAVDLDERPQTGELPEDYVQRLAYEKAYAAKGKLQHAAVVLGADTVVIHDGNVLGKPGDKDDFNAMMRVLSGSTHQVITAVSVLSGEHNLQTLVSSTVAMREISEDEADRYWQTGEPQDKAGGYGIQGYGAIFVNKIEGSYSNIVGLPLFETSRLLQQFEVPLWCKAYE